MNTSWLPHWTTVIALGCGLAGALYPKLPPASKGPGSRNFQEKHVEDVASVVAYGLFVLSLALLGTLDAIFLAIGWSRSPWAWSVAGGVSLLWSIGRLGRLWLRLPVSKGAPRSADSAHPQTPMETAKNARPTDAGAGHP